MTAAETEKHLMTDRVLEHSIFSNRPIYIMDKNDPDKKSSFFVEEILKDCFIAEVGPENFTKVKRESLKAKDLQVVIGHKDQAFIFSSQLMDSLEETPSKKKKKRTHFFFRKPPTGELKNQRVATRFALNNNSFLLKAEIKVTSKLGDFTFETRHLVDLSQTSLTLFLDRTQGLVLPGDRVKSLTLYSQNEIVLETEGSVLRTDMKRVSEQIGNSYFAVIEMKREPVPTQWPLSEQNGTWGIRMDRNKAFVEAEHSILQGYGFSGEVRYLSTSNVSFSVEKQEIPFVAGMVFNDIYINIPPNDLKLKACLQITHCNSENDPEGSWCVVYGKFLGMSIDLIKAVNRLKDGLIDLRLVEAQREDFDQLMEFFFDTGFIYSAKRKQLQKYSEGVKRTNLKLLKSDGAIIKKVIFKDHREIKGHISALRFFDRAWLVQHMMTHNTPGTAIARAILNSISNFFQDPAANRKVGTNFVTCYYQPGNLYPEMVFGETQRMVANPDICGITDLDFCVSAAAETGLKNVRGKSRIKCHEAQAEDLARLECLLVTQGHFFPIRIEGLTAEGMTKLEVSEEYRKIGLYRHRRVFVARDSDGEVLYAICNYSSPGCNLSELTNSFRFYYSGSGSQPSAEVANALSQHVLSTYRETEMNAPALLLGANQLIPDKFKKIRKYRYWYFDAAFCDLFKRVSEFNLTNAKEILKKLRAGTDSESANFGKTNPETIDKKDKKYESV